MTKEVDTQTFRKGALLRYAIFIPTGIMLIFLTDAYGIEGLVLSVYILTILTIIGYIYHRSLP